MHGSLGLFTYMCSLSSTVCKHMDTYIHIDTFEHKIVMLEEMYLITK